MQIIFENVFIFSDITNVEKTLLNKRHISVNITPNQKKYHFAFSNFKSCRKEIAVTFLIHGELSNLKPFKDLVTKNYEHRERMTMLKLL